ncbi:MAG: hypothetical protein ACLQU4_11775 [Limisphaerales bacterium]
MKKLTIPKVCFCAAITALVSGCQITVGPGSASVEVAQPVVEVAPPAYVWDGVEYVGVYNGQYMYFGPGGVWVVCDPFILDRFHSWERYHADWRDHAIRNDGEHRLDRVHRPAGMNRAVAPARRTAAPEGRAVAPERKMAAPEARTAAPERRTVAPEKKTVAPGQKAAAPAKKAAPQKKEEKKDEK